MDKMIELKEVDFITGMLRVNCNIYMGENHPHGIGVNVKLVDGLSIVLWD
jgi:hypothetical protein